MSSTSNGVVVKQYGVAEVMLRPHAQDETANVTCLVYPLEEEDAAHALAVIYNYIYEDYDRHLKKKGQEVIFVPFSTPLPSTLTVPLYNVEIVFAPPMQLGMNLKHIEESSLLLIDELQPKMKPTDYAVVASIWKQYVQDRRVAIERATLSSTAAMRPAVEAEGGERKRKLPSRKPLKAGDGVKVSPLLPGCVPNNAVQMRIKRLPRAAPEDDSSSSSSSSAF